MLKCSRRFFSAKRQIKYIFFYNEIKLKQFESSDFLIPMSLQPNVLDVGYIFVIVKAVRSNR